MNELSIEPDYLRNLILKVRGLMARELTVTPDSGSNPIDDDLSADALQDTPGDLSRDEILAEFEGLNASQKAELVALMWLGRGDAEPEEWQDTVRLARERREGSTAEYLLDHPLLADYWTTGLEKLGHGSAMLEWGEY